MKVSKEYFRGCLLGGATADAKGYHEHAGGKNLISDNTQLTSFTLDGLVWADDRAIKRGVYAYIPCLFYSYQKWYYTQTGNLADKSYEFILKGEILDWEELFTRRGTGETSMIALEGSIGNKFGTIKNRINNSKGCGSVIRVAPIGMYFWKNEEMAFRIGAESGALTHGHTDAILASGFYAAFIANLIAGLPMTESIGRALRRLKDHPGHENCSGLIDEAVELGTGARPVIKCMEEIGEGFTADEAAALAVFLCLRFSDDFDGAVKAATTFSGNKHSIPPLAGNALGAYLGMSAIPHKWIDKVELYDLIVHGSDIMLERMDMDDLPIDIEE
jgi:ADP-ribosylglycohydrolase